jgi:hypothetical protein
LWGGIGQGFKFHLVSCFKACFPISRGRLWIRYLLFYLIEFFWGSGFGIMFMRERPYRGCLWIINMAASGVWFSNEVHGSFGVGPWKNIRKEWGEFSSHTIFEVSDGSKIRFWHDMWCGDKALKAAFPDLFKLAHCKGLKWQIIWRFLLTLINGMLTFLE